MADDYGLTVERKAKIDSMSHFTMCSNWRFSKTGDWKMMGECGDYFKERLFKHFGGFTPAISKRLGH